MDHFNCYVIGEGSLLTKCADILLERKLEILAIITSEQMVQRWANEKNIKCLTLNEAINSSTLIACDYLFSIVNYYKIPDSILTLPRYFAINYHDALLPKYAGIHATSWAILNEEKQHGVTWHIMTQKIDAGDILKQASIGIAPNETALSLNLKCQDLAVNTFTELLVELTEHQQQRIPQQLTQRSYYGRDMKPPANGWIQWETPLSEIDKLCRALQFGHTPNRLASAKFALGRHIFILDSYRTTNQPSIDIPGTIIITNQEELQVATKTFNLAITSVRATDGKFYKIPELCSKYQLSKGCRFKIFTHDENLILEKSGHYHSKNEAFWVDELKNYKSIEIPFLVGTELIKQSFTYTHLHATNFNKTELKSVQKKYNALAEEVLMTLTLVYLYRLNNHENLSLEYYSSSIRKDDLLLASHVLLNTHFNDGMDILDALKHIQETIKTLATKEGYFSDIYCRYPKLSDGPQSLSCGLILADCIHDCNFKQLNIHNAVIFLIERPKNTLHLFVNESLPISVNLKVLLKQIPGHIKELLHTLTANQEKSIAQANLLTKKERATILEKWNATETPLPTKTVSQLFETQVLKTPNNIALKFKNKALTYEQLNQQSNQYAHYLSKKGVGTNDIVAICLDRDLSMVIAMLGILKAGGAYAPIDLDYPEARINYMLKDSQAKLLITQQSLVDRMPNLFHENIELVLLDKHLSIIKSEAINNLSYTAQTNQLIYLIYTSGTTGNPKGVLIEHHSVINCLTSVAKNIKISANDLFLAATSLSFDVSVLDYFLPLLYGATVVIADEEDRRDGQRLINLLHHHKISAMQATPSTWQVLVMEGWRGHRHFKILTAGEVLPQNLSENLQQCGFLFTLYGPTETTIYSTMTTAKNNAPVTIGKPMANTKIYVLNRYRMPQAVGMTGEIYIGGAGLARGYLNQPEATKNNFIDELSIDNQKFRLYKTGDLGRWLPDGTIEFMGRIDHQIKLHGYRIEPGEIEHTLIGYPGIKQAVVLPLTENVRKQLIAYYILEDELKNSVDGRKLKEYLSKKLAPFMLPNFYIQLNEIPLTTSGKIDRSSLLKLYQKTKISREGIDTTNATPLEKELCIIWRNALELPAIALDENFFYLGGDSILAMQIASNARQRDIHFTIKQLLLHPTISGLASVIKNNHQIDTEVIETTEKFFPLAPIQSRFFNHQFKMANQWGQVCLIDILKWVDQTTLYQAIQELPLKHQELTLLFIRKNTGWKQYYSDNTSMPFHTVNLTDSLDQHHWEQLIDGWKLKIQNSFDIEKGPLFATVLFKLNGIPQKLLLAAHHLIVDGISWRILIQDLVTSYQNIIKNQQPIVVHKTASYKNWVLELHRYASECITDEEKAFWSRTNAIEPLPKDFLQSLDKEEDARSCTAQLSVAETQQLLRQPMCDAALQINDILLTILARTFEKWTGKSHIFIDMESHGREEIVHELNLSHTVGWFTSIYPLYLTWTPMESLPKLLQSIKNQVRLIPKNGITYGILHYLKPNQKVTKTIQNRPQAEINFNYWGQFNTSIENDIFQLKSLQLVSAKKNHRPYSIEVNCWVRDKQFHISLTYNQHHYKQETIKSLVDNYLCLSREFLQKQGLPNEMVQSNLPSITKEYPLTPIQTGMLFHRLHNPESESYCVQLLLQFNDKLDIHLLNRAYEIIHYRYDVFRTSFHWEEAHIPVQKVHSKVKPLMRHYDWRNLSKNHLQKRLKSFLKMDREAGFDLNQAPLMRLACILVSENSYRLVFTLPHMIFDGWSIPILFRELSSIYQTLSAGEVIELTQSRPYSDYVAWLQGQNSKIRNSELFWRNYLAGFSVPTDLKAIQAPASSSANLTVKYRTTEVILSKKISKRVKYFAKQHQLTLNTIFQGLWATLLTRYSQTEDLVFGVTISTRSQELLHCEEMIGLFINTVPLRIKSDSNSTVLAYLNQIQTNFMNLVDHRHTPLTTIESWSEISSAFNLFETVMVFENYPVDSSTQLFDASQVKIDDPSHYPIVFYIIPGQQFLLKINYDNGLISKSTAKRLMGHLQILLNEIICHPEKSINTLSLLTRYESKKFITDAYTPPGLAYLDKVPHQVFEQRVEEHPNATAIIFENQSLTYRQLNERANQLAHHLIHCGVEPESIVAICIERSLEMIIGILGILKAGGAYLPIEPTSPNNRIGYILVNSKTQFLLSQPHLIDRFTNNIPNNVQQIFIDSDQSKFEQELNENPIHVTKENHLMYVIYTSGSTGNPKGVLLEQKNVMQLFNGANQYCAITEKDVWTLFHSIAFDFSVWEIWGALLHGGSLVIVPYASTQATDDFYKILIKHQVTIVSQTPSAFHQLAIVDNLLKEKLFLRLIILDGEVLAPKIADLWFQSHDYQKPKLINMYGITETTVHLTYCEVTPYKLINDLRYPIGKGLPGVALYLLDKHLQPVPVGVPGEIYVGGKFLARGYIDSTLTKQRFLNNSFDSKVGHRLYKTGDQARRLENAEIDYLGRIDNQIKFRGYRIELDEITTLIEKHPDIAHAAVVIYQTKQNDSCFTAYYTSKMGSPIESKSIKQYLSAVLPNYMIPDLFIFLEHFPLTSNGKIDKKVLPKPSKQLLISDKIIEPRNKEERILSNIWKTVLGLENLSVDDNFFDLGGHSLLALELLVHIKHAFSTDLPVRTILDASTIAELAKLIKDNEQLGSTAIPKIVHPVSPCIVPLQPLGNKTPIFLVHPLGGTVFWYLPMSKYFNKNQPVYGIQDPGVEQPDNIPFETLEELAGFYIKTIKKIQRRGPYLLGGASGGAIISFEMARQFLLAGEQVDFVGLYDGWVPHPEQLRHEEVFEAVMRRQYNLMQEKFRAKGIESAEKLLKLQWQRAQMLDKYQMTVINQQLILFKAKEITPIYQPYSSSPFNHWESYSTYPIIRYDVPGDHETMFYEPYAQGLTKLTTGLLIKEPKSSYEALIVTV